MKQILVNTFGRLSSFNLASHVYSKKTLDVIMKMLLYIMEMEKVNLFLFFGHVQDKIQR